MDIHSSNTRAELAIELAGYQDELAKLKSKQNRANETQSAIIHANSRSSSGVYLVIIVVSYYAQSFCCFFYFSK